MNEPIAPARSRLRRGLTGLFVALTVIALVPRRSRHGHGRSSSTPTASSTTVGPVIDDPAVQEALAVRLTDRIMTALDVEEPRVDLPLERRAATASLSHPPCSPDRSRTASGTDSSPIAAADLERRRARHLVHGDPDRPRTGGGPAPRRERHRDDRGRCCLPRPPPARERHPRRARAAPLGHLQPDDRHPGGHDRERLTGRLAVGAAVRHRPARRLRQDPGLRVRRAPGGPGRGGRRGPRSSTC